MGFDRSGPLSEPLGLDRSSSCALSSLASSSSLPFSNEEEERSQDHPDDPDPVVNSDPTTTFTTTPPHLQALTVLAVNGTLWIPRYPQCYTHKPSMSHCHTTDLGVGFQVLFFCSQEKIAIPYLGGSWDVNTPPGVVRSDIATHFYLVCLVLLQSVLDVSTSCYLGEVVFP